MITFTDFMFGIYKTPELSEQYILPDDLKPDNINKLGIPLDFRAAFAFPRKNGISLDELGRERNPTYSRSEDPILLQAIWLIQPTQEYWLKLKVEHNKALNAAKESKRQMLLAEQERIARELEELG